METGGAGVDAVVAEFLAHRLGAQIDGETLAEADPEFFSDIARGVVEAQRRVDRVIEGCLAENWTLGRLDATARAILRAGVYELMRRPEVPARAVIDEYVEIAKAFFDGVEPRFVNGALDAAARRARAEEFGQGAA